jgi:hypothetical protein
MRYGAEAVTQSGAHVTGSCRLPGSSTYGEMISSIILVRHPCPSLCPSLLTLNNRSAFAVFHAYAAITATDIHLFVDASRFDEGVAEHLAPTTVYPYKSYAGKLKELVAATDGTNRVLQCHFQGIVTAACHADCSLVWVTERCSQDVVSAIPQAQVRASCPTSRRRDR